jgi:hypothetical protein
MKFVASFLIAILFGSVAVAQQTGDEVIRTKANLVNIDVIVKDKKGKYIPDLKAEDFTIVENGVAQKIEFFDAPLTRTETKTTTTPDRHHKHEASARGHVEVSARADH